VNPSTNSLDARHSLMALARRYHEMGWMLGTGGNLSSRYVSGTDEDRFIITASGRDKRVLQESDFVEMLVDSESVQPAPGDLKPSAETEIHRAIYRRFPNAAAVLHVHTVASTLARPQGQLPGAIRFEALEMLKAWELWEEGATAELPVFENHGDVAKIAATIDEAYKTPPPVPALLIAGHGITAWGDTLHAANRHLEVTEFMCRLHLARQSALS